MAKILITGSSGFIGSHLKKAIPFADGLDVIPSDATNLVCDVCDFEEVEKYDVIYHLAAIANYDYYSKHPLETYITNVCGTMNLLRQNSNALFIFPSSVGVSEKNWSDPYILSKAICEKIVRLMSDNFIIFRFANIYGKGAKAVVNKFIDNPIIDINGSGEQVRDFVYIDDLIEWLIKVNEIEKNKLYYIGSGIKTTINQLAKTVTKILGPKPIEYKPNRKFDVFEPIIKADLKCGTSLEIGIRKTTS